MEFSLDPNSLYSSAQYSVERVCPGTPTPTQLSCSSTLLQPWEAINIPESTGFTVPPSTFNYVFPVKITLVDAGYAAERYKVSVDGDMVGLTGEYNQKPSLHCGLTAADVDNCIAKGYSKGSFIVPAGEHTVTFGTFQSIRREYLLFCLFFLDGWMDRLIC